VSAPRVHVIILNWNGWRDTVECLESLLRCDYPNLQLVVCDNGSEDDSLSKIMSWAEGRTPPPEAEQPQLARLTTPPVDKPIACRQLQINEILQPGEAIDDLPLVLIDNGANLGFAAGNNSGFRYALSRPASDYLWLLNNDTLVEPDALSMLVDWCENHPNASCGSLVCFYDDPGIIQALGGASFNRWSGIASTTLGRFLRRDESLDHETWQQQLDYITGCSWLLPRAWLEQVGLMEENYFLYYEEIDWVTRAAPAFSIGYSPQSVVYHKEGRSIGSKSLNRSSSLLSEFYLARNKLRYTYKFNRLMLPTVWISTLLQAINRLRQGSPAKAWLLFRVCLGKKYYP
jgi:GT2 family glycosyltransferase